MKSVIEKLEDVAEGLRSEYEPFNGKFRLKLEDTPPNYVKAEDLLAANNKVIQFRDNNIALLKEVEELRPLKTQFEGIDAAAAKDAIEKVKKLGSKGIKDIEDFETRVKSTVEDAVKPLREQLQQSVAEVAAERKRADEFLLHSKIADQFVKLGGKAKATDFIVEKAKEAFEVKDKSVVAKSGKFSTTSPGDPLGLDEWLQSSVKEYDFAFEPSNGGGAPVTKGSTGPAAPVVLKPGQTVLKNPSPQELGQYSAEIAAGKVKVVHETA